MQITTGAATARKRELEHAQITRSRGPTHLVDVASRFYDASIANQYTP